MRGKTLRNLIGDVLFLALTALITIGHGIDGSWFWFCVWAAISVLGFVVLVVDATLALVDPKGRR